MEPKPTIPLAIVARRARYRLEELAADLPYAGPDDREALHAGIEFERWLLESCRRCR
ncbi:MAG TPA: hypothetical protein PKK06_05625 [Phycisphaerae bacterium]|nr:hypothetical protein [Phycisphaerae bacterium]HNU44762.1 hypothetical protein [Phycisphaerae bacterium]